MQRPCRTWLPWSACGSTTVAAGQRPIMPGHSAMMSGTCSDLDPRSSYAQAPSRCRASACMRRSRATARRAAWSSCPTKAMATGEPTGCRRQAASGTRQQRSLQPCTCMPVGKKLASATNLQLRMCRARESILHTLYETDVWLSKYVGCGGEAPTKTPVNGSKEPEAEPVSAAKL